MVEKSLDEIGAPILVVEIVGVLPDIAGQERRLATGDRVDRVRGLDHFELAGIENQPGPAAAELRGRGFFERGSEFIEAAEIVLDRFFDTVLWLAAAVLLHALPEEGVVPGLRRIVEHGRLG